MVKNLFPRTRYLDRIRPFYHDEEMIKVVSGVRRCGKSSLLSLVLEELIASGVPKESILSINLDKRPYKSVKTTAALEKIVDGFFSGVEGMKYLFIDEIQNVKGFEETINAYREEGDYSIFITGSNSYMLSGELVTKLTGRYIEMRMTTLTFEEYLKMKAFYGKPVLDDLEKELNNYILEGGFPRAVMYDTLEQKRVYVQSVVDEIFDKDIKHNRKIRKKRLFDLIMQFIINNFGCTVSVDKLTANLKSILRENVRKETVYRYINEMENLRIISRCSRFDLKSKRSLRGDEKYYLSDLSFYFLRNTDNRIPYGPVLENIVYQYAESLSYSVSVGKIGNLEVDFILRKPDMDYAYVQVAMYIFNGAEDGSGVNQTEEREYRSLEAIRDSYPKFLLTLDHMHQRRNGIVHANLAEFIKEGKMF